MQSKSESEVHADGKFEYNKKSEKLPTSVQQTNTTINGNFIQRITTDDKRIEQCDNYGLNKLAEIHELHTKQNNLTLQEPEKILQNLDNYVKSVPAKSCLIEQTQLIECLKQNRCQSLTCNEEVQEFVNCVDKSFYNVTHVDLSSTQANKKLTYTEKFKRGV